MKRWKIGMLLVAVCFCLCQMPSCLDALLIGCAAQGKARDVTWLLKLGADPNTRSLDRGDAIRESAVRNQPVTLRLLLNAGGDPNGRAESGETALVLAAGRGNEKICRILLRAKADPNLDDGDGTTPLTYAASYPDVVKLLKEYDATH